MNYTKENCPVCGKQFTETDDIAVCPVCGTPHHRACYLENKACANLSKHAEGFEWKPSDEPSLNFVEHHSYDKDSDEKVVCPYCGRENGFEEPVCTSCGARLYNGPQGAPVNPMGQPPYGNVVQIQQNDVISGHTVADTADFVQRHADKYIPKFYKMERTDRKSSFNWAAFLFAPYWFFYRKMHVIGFGIMIVMLLVSVLCNTADVRAADEQLNTAYEQYLEGNSDITQEQLSQMASDYITMPEMLISAGFSILVHVLSGVFGDYLYKKKVKKDIDWAKEGANSPEQYRLLLFSRGGVSVLMVVLSAVGYFCAGQIIGRFL